MGFLDKLFRSKRSEQQPNVKALPTELYFDIVRQQMAESGRGVVRVTGVSMKPFLFPIRDTVTIIPPDDTLKVGDIALFDTKRGRFILHRVTRVGEFDFDMRGDNTSRGEKKLPKALLVGIVDSAERKGRTIKRDSGLFRLYAFVSPAHYTYRFILSGIRFVLSKIYHFFIPGKTEENRNA